MENITMKDLKGKEVFLRPTGKNIRSNNPNEIIRAKIINVGRVYATFTRGDFHIEDNGRINGLHLDTGHNSGYQVFPDKKEIDNMLFIESTARKIANSFQYAQHYEKLDRETITKVASLIGIQI